ncbi:unnamed protein product [Protopolystoma xenopodis]|uniref:Uncharacterized protein n=1 Tax=Protopolystoma xenopodis TaxID=117903 RepID=A0A448WCF1_9PLAT|nr:unnamed protein product [Protopolystoma xenopodis]
MTRPANLAIGSCQPPGLQTHIALPYPPNSPQTAAIPSAGYIVDQQLGGCPQFVVSPITLSTHSGTQVTQAAALHSSSPMPRARPQATPSPPIHSPASLAQNNHSIAHRSALSPGQQQTLSQYSTMHHARQQIPQLHHHAAPSQEMPSQNGLYLTSPHMHPVHSVTHTPITSLPYPYQSGYAPHESNQALLAGGSGGPSGSSLSPGPLSGSLLPPISVTLAQSPSGLHHHRQQQQQMQPGQSHLCEPHNQTAYSAPGTLSHAFQTGIADSLQMSSAQLSGSAYSSPEVLASSRQPTRIPAAGGRSQDCFSQLQPPQSIHSSTGVLADTYTYPQAQTVSSRRLAGPSSSSFPPSVRDISADLTAQTAEGDARLLATTCGDVVGLAGNPNLAAPISATEATPWG